MKQGPTDKYEQVLDEINWTGGVGRPAGVYWLAGESRIAAHESAAEAYLLQQGAILIATLLFERDPLDGRPDGRRYERLSDARARAEFVRTDAN